MVKRRPPTWTNMREFSVYSIERLRYWRDEFIDQARTLRSPDLRSELAWKAREYNREILRERAQLRAEQ